MNNFKVMKIRTQSEFDVERVQQALYNLGYKWHPLVDDSRIYKFVEDCYGLHARSNGHIVRTSYDDDVSSFNYSEEQEHVLFNGKFVAVDDYFTYPETTYEPLPEEQNVPSITPRVEYLRQRASEILAGMTRFNEMKLVPPSEWHLELEDIFEEIKNA